MSFLYSRLNQGFFAYNYRPMSLLPNIGKLIEKIMQQRLNHFLKQQNSFCPAQFGFCLYHSRNNALISIIERMQQLDNNNYTVGALVDLKKVFGTVDHDMLIEKLHHYGVGGILKDWFTSYLQYRKQYATLNDHKSTIKMIQTEVSQGSVLGPLSFPNLHQWFKCINTQKLIISLKIQMFCSLINPSLS